MAIIEHICPSCNYFITDSEKLLTCPSCCCNEITNTEILKSAELVEYDEKELDGELYGDDDLFDEDPLVLDIESDIDL
jgi:hypothetical protein